MSGHWRFSSCLFISVFILVGLAFGEDAAVNDSQNCEDCNSSCCAPEVCGAWFTGCCDPLWTVRADGLLLHRSKPRDRILSTNRSTPGGTTLLNANDFDLGFSSGWDVSIIRRNVLDTCWGVEGLYYSVDNWYASRAIERSATGAWVQFQTPIGNGAYPMDVSGFYRSGLHNAELNARRAIGCWGDFLIGFRYVDLDERLDIFQTVITTPVNPGTYDITSSNQLAGLQIGFDGHIYTYGRLTIDGLVKAGVFNDKAGNNVAFTQSRGLSYHSADSTNHTASLEELAFTSVYQLNCRWSVRGGYQLMWLQGVALASDQVAVSDPINGVATVNTNGCPFYHGAVIGLECNF